MDYYTQDHNTAIKRYDQARLLSANWAFGVIEGQWQYNSSALRYFRLASGKTPPTGAY